MSGSNQLAAISLDELERLIRLLGMLGSDFDAEVLAAARLAVRWVAEKHTDWRTLLTPPEEPGVVSVSVAASDADLEARAQAFDQGYQAGLKQGLASMAAQVKAQAAMAGNAQTRHQTASAMWGTIAGNAPHSPLGAGLRGSWQQTTGSAHQPAQGPVRASAAPAGGYPPGSWQAVCQELLDRDDAGVPGVLRSRERTFVADVLARGFPTLTQAQEDWLRDIARRNSLHW